MVKAYEHTGAWAAIVRLGYGWRPGGGHAAGAGLGFPGAGFWDA